MVAASQDDVRHVHDGPDRGPPEHGAGAMRAGLSRCAAMAPALASEHAQKPETCCRSAKISSRIHAASMAFVHAFAVHLS